MGSAARFGPAGGREVGTRPSARVGLDEGFYLHRQGPFWDLLPVHVRRSAGPEFGSDAASRGYLGPIN